MKTAELEVMKGNVKKEDVLALLADLEEKKEKIERYPGFVEDFPSHYVGAAIYSYIIMELRGLIE